MSLNTSVARMEASGPDLDSFLAAAQIEITDVLGLDFLVLATVDPASSLETSCIVQGIPEDPNREMRIFELEWFSDDPLKYHDLALSERPAGALRLTTDPMEVRRYVEIGVPNGVYDELRVACLANGVWWATVTGFRFEGSPAFTQSDVDRAIELSSAVAYGFRRGFLHAATERPAGLDLPPGAFTIDPSGRTLTTTASAEYLLETLAKDQVPSATRALAAAVEAKGSATLTVAGLQGPISFHGIHLKGQDGEISVIVEHPRPTQLTPLIIAAVGLTPREREVVEAVLSGLLTKQIARQLGISEYTVQDHLKAVFDKTETRTRGELCARLYADFYFGPRQSEAPPGPYGYFLLEPSID